MRWLSVGAYAASLFTYPLGLFAPVLLLALEVRPVGRRTWHWNDWFSRQSRLAVWRQNAALPGGDGILSGIGDCGAAVPDARYRPVSLVKWACCRA